jgi:hypothetical protein
MRVDGSRLVLIENREGDLPAIAADAAPGDAHRSARVPAEGAPAGFRVAGGRGRWRRAGKKSGADRLVPPVFPGPGRPMVATSRVMGGARAQRASHVAPAAEHGGRRSSHGGQAPITRRPAVVTRRPAVITRRPAVITRRPEVITRRPAVITRRPAVINQRAGAILRPDQPLHGLRNGLETGHRLSELAERGPRRRIGNPETSGGPKRPGGSTESTNVPSPAERGTAG